MSQPQFDLFSRRRFLATGSAAAVSSLSLSRLRAAEGTGETDQFFYRLSPPDGPYIDSQRGNKAFAFTPEKILYSEDNGKSWARQTPFPDAANVLWSTFLKNGNILFATRANLYLST
ncbi:MAG: hypothetical protein KDL87_15625, partial [Verrucomicrobiae bacterium]|nr:hypothetical protein [Verrucomicrobiae bacterium]